MRKVPSLDADTIRVPSGENATVVTSWECPSRMAMDWPDATSQMRTVLSLDADPIRVPLGEKVTPVSCAE